MSLADHGPGTTITRRDAAELRAERLCPPCGSCARVVAPDDRVVECDRSRDDTRRPARASPRSADVAAAVDDLEVSGGGVAPERPGQRARRLVHGGSSSVRDDPRPPRRASVERIHGGDARDVATAEDAARDRWSAFAPVDRALRRGRHASSQTSTVAPANISFSKSVDGKTRATVRPSGATRRGGFGLALLPQRVHEEARSGSSA